MITRDAYGLSAIDRRIITLVARGCMSTEIASLLQWSELALKVRLKRIYRDLGVKNRAELVQWAQEHL